MKFGHPMCQRGLVSLDHALGQATDPQAFRWIHPKCWYASGVSQVYAFRLKNGIGRDAAWITFWRRVQREVRFSRKSRIPRMTPMFATPVLSISSHLLSPLLPIPHFIDSPPLSSLSACHRFHRQVSIDKFHRVSIQNPSQDDQNALPDASCQRVKDV